MIKPKIKEEFCSNCKTKVKTILRINKDESGSFDWYCHRCEKVLIACRRRDTIQLPRQII